MTKEIKEIIIRLDRAKSEKLARFLALMEIQIKAEPELFPPQMYGELSEVYKDLDYQIHEVANFCDKGDQCPYWIKKSKTPKTIQ